jgi:hypothetical protein
MLRGILSRGMSKMQVYVEVMNQFLKKLATFMLQLPITIYQFQYITADSGNLQRVAIEGHATQLDCDELLKHSPDIEEQMELQVPANSISVDFHIDPCHSNRCTSP